MWTKEVRQHVDCETDEPQPFKSVVEIAAGIDVLIDRLRLEEMWN
jgi:hypothetical protein